MINSFVIEPGIGQEGIFIHEVLLSFPPRSGFVQQVVRADAGKFCGASRLVLVAARLDSNVIALDNEMLILTGTAEYMEDDECHIKGERYAFNVFSSSEILNDELKEEIGTFMGDAGWNEIDVKKTTLVPNEQNIEDKTTLEAFSYALKNKFSIVVYGGPVDEKVKL